MRMGIIEQDVEQVLAPGLHAEDAVADHYEVPLVARHVTLGMLILTPYVGRERRLGLRAINELRRLLVFL